MERQSIILIFDRKMNCVLMRKQSKAPRNGICTLIGTVAGEDPYAVLEEQTGITAQQVHLAHLSTLESVCDVYTGRFLERDIPDGTICGWMPLRAFKAWCKSRDIGQLGLLADYAQQLMLSQEA